MFAQQRTIRVPLAFSILLALSVAVGCGPGPQPTSTATPTLSPVALTLDVNPSVREIEAGKTVGIVARMTTGEAASLRWSVTGNSGGRVSPETGDAVFYTAGNPGVDIVTAEGTTAKGTPAKERVSFNVVPASRVTPVTPSATPVPPIAKPVSPTATLPPAPGVTPTLTTPPIVTPTLTTTCPSFRPRLKGAANFTGTVEIRIPANCTTGLPAETMMVVAGTYEGIPSNVDIWVLTYPPNMVYYPQSPNACAGEKMKWGDGRWQVQAYLGEKGGLPEWFDIVVILADQNTSQFLINWVRDGCARNWQNYVGIPATTLEQMNITEKGYITVQTKD